MDGDVHRSGLLLVDDPRLLLVHHRGLKDGLLVKAGEGNEDREGGEGGDWEQPPM